MKNRNREELNNTIKKGKWVLITLFIFFIVVIILTKL